jgi:hypothetical protein
MRRSLFTLLIAFPLVLTACGGAPTTGDTAEQFTGTITELLASGRDVTCTFTRTDESGEMQGTIYVTQDKRMRGDMTLENAEFGTMAMHVTRDGDTGYTWGFPSETEGTTMKLDDDGSPIDEDEAGLDEPMEYTCRSWTVDASMLTPPSNVTFRDISAQMEQFQQAVQGIQDGQCSACDQLPEAARASCRQAMKC